jgi:hypothetical protein
MSHLAGDIPPPDILLGAAAIGNVTFDGLRPATARSPDAHPDPR